MTGHDTLPVWPVPHSINDGRELLEGGRVSCPGEPDRKEHRNRHQARRHTSVLNHRPSPRAERILFWLQCVARPNKASGPCWRGSVEPPVHTPSGAGLSRKTGLRSYRTCPRKKPPPSRRRLANVPPSHTLL